MTYPRYYVFDDLRWQQNTEERKRVLGENVHAPNITRVDTLEEALELFRKTESYMTPALGMSLSDMKEMDLIHRREGEPVLVMDYQRSADWRTNPDVLSSVQKLCRELNVEWQSDGRLFKNEFVLTPLSIPSHMAKNGRVSKYMDDKDLDASESPAGRCSALYAIEEVYTSDGGWVPFKQFWDRVQEYGYSNPHTPKLENLSVRYLRKSPENPSAMSTGYIDISPEEWIVLQERFNIVHGTYEEAEKAAAQLAADLYDFAKEVDPYEYKDTKDDVPKEQQITALRDAILSDKTKEIRTFLKGTEASKISDAVSVTANNLQRRLKTFSRARLRAPLDMKIQNAKAAASGTGSHDKQPGREAER